MKHSYYIVYIFTKDDVNHYGSCVVNCQRLKNTEHINRIREHIEEDKGIESVLILNIVKL